MRRTLRIATATARWLFYALAAIAVIVGIALAGIETEWGRNQIRQLIVRQANQYLAATLEIGRLQGSLLRGIELGDVRISQNGQTLVAIDDVSLSYSIRELFDRGTIIRRIRLARPRIVAEKLADGRWNLGALVKRDASSGRQRGPRRPILIRSIEVSDGSVAVHAPLRLGFAKLPTQVEDLDLNVSFSYDPVLWRLDIQHASWLGRAPDMSMRKLSGGVQQSGEGWTFENLFIETPKSRLTVDGVLDRRVSPSVLSLNVKAGRFGFQEWAGAVGVLRNIAIDAEFEAALTGPAKRLNTTLALRSNGGHLAGTFVIDTTSPGWRAEGEVRLERLNLAPWLSRPEDRSDISGRVSFDIRMPPDARFPRGAYAFDGSHAAYRLYEGDDVKARGHITPTEVRIAEGTATAYGANIRLESGSIGVGTPYRFTFVGIADGVDLRQLPPNVPVPHVESTLSFHYDVTGQFSAPFLKGSAVFERSEFLRVAIDPGATGSLDTSVSPFEYAGQGEISQVDMNYLGTGLDVAWLREPRYAGTLSGRFHVQGRGADAATMTLRGGGRLTRADLFGGQLLEADVSIDIQTGTLSGAYAGQLKNINPAIALEDPRFDALLNGSGRGHLIVRELLVRSPELKDYSIDAEVNLGPSRLRTVDVEHAELSAALTSGTLKITRLQGSGPSLDLRASGVVELDGQRGSQLDYVIERADLALLEDFIDREVDGGIATTGRMSGPTSRLRFVGGGTVTQLAASGVHALSGALKYDVSVPVDAPARANVAVDGRLSLVEAFGQQIKEASGIVTYDAGHVTADVQLVRDDRVSGSLEGAFRVSVADRQVDLETLSVTVNRAVWLLAKSGSPRVAWNDRGIVIGDVALTDAVTGAQRITASGSWYPSGGGTLRVTASRVSLDALVASGQGPARYGGLIELDALIRGTRAQPIVTGQVMIAEGRVWRTSYERLSGRVDYMDSVLDIDLRLDQAPGVWLAAAGRVPVGVLAGQQQDGPIDLKVESSAINLGLIEGVTNVVRDVAGQAQINVRATGTLRNPQLAGHIDIAGAGFVATASGTRYKNARAVLQFSPDRILVETLHVEDLDGHPLDVSGSLATRALRVSDLTVNVRARSFEVLRNEFGWLDMDANLALRGQFESPRLSGRLTVTGGQLEVDSILDRALFRPYSTRPTMPETEADAIAALNPWERLGLDIELDVPGTLRMVGDNVQVAAGTPLGLGNINLRAIGDLYLYKDPAQPMYVTGSLDSVTGTYAFQGRRFELNPSSSINFRGDINPELYVTVRREISSVETRVTISGPLSEPELQLSSTPPLEASDILSLIVFNTSMNQLSASQQRDLAVRAGTIAAGFVAAPLLTAIEESLGLETLEIEPGADISGGTRVTIGNEIAPGLVARFSRQFGPSEYDEATIEYYLSRIFRIRATFSDATSLAARSPFRRVERAGIDVLLFFSF